MTNRTPAATSANLYGKGRFAIVSGDALGDTFGDAHRYRSPFERAPACAHAIFRADAPVAWPCTVRLAGDAVWDVEGETFWVGGDVDARFARGAVLAQEEGYVHPATRAPVWYAWTGLVLLVAASGEAFLVRAEHALDGLYHAYGQEFCSVELDYPGTDDLIAEAEVVEAMGFVRPVGDREVLPATPPPAAPPPARPPARVFVGPYCVERTAAGATLTHRHGGLVPRRGGGHARALDFPGVAAARAHAEAAFAALRAGSAHLATACAT